HVPECGQRTVGGDREAHPRRRNGVRERARDVEHRLEGGASGEALGCGAAACAVQGLERPVARAPRACLDVLAPYVGAPALDAANEAAARGRDFVRVGGDRTGELDRPQLSGEPPGQVRYAAGMHAAATQGWVAGRDPWTGPAVSGHRPAKVAERTD